jgi:hypothetical protein
MLEIPWCAFFNIIHVNPSIRASTSSHVLDGWNMCEVR